jgi:NADH-quinone oxidoreductase subunit J
MVMLVFYLVALLAVASAVVAVSHKSPVVNVLSLVVTFFCVAVNYALLGAGFLAAAQILIYAGAILVLFLFVIMLLNVEGPAQADDRPFQRVAGLATVTVIALAGLALPFAARAAVRPGAVAGDVNAIGKALLGPYALAFELITVVLLAAMVGAMVLVKRKH